MIANCVPSTKLRTFAVSRISEVEVIDKHFDLPEDFDVNDLLGSHFGIMWGEQEYAVSILFNSSSVP